MYCLGVKCDGMRTQKAGEKVRSDKKNKRKKRQHPEKVLMSTGSRFSTTEGLQDWAKPHKARRRALGP